MLHHLIDIWLPEIISAMEILGIIVVVVGAIKAFFDYGRYLIFRRKIPQSQVTYEYDLLKAMNTGLEFKLAAEILKTVLIQDLNELLVLACIIILRALLTFLIHFEMKDAHGAHLARAHRKAAKQAGVLAALHFTRRHSYEEGHRDATHGHGSRFTVADIDHVTRDAQGNVHHVHTTPGEAGLSDLPDSDVCGMEREIHEATYRDA